MTDYILEITRGSEPESHQLVETGWPQRPGTYRSIAAPGEDWIWDAAITAPDGTVGSHRPRTATELNSAARPAAIARMTTARDADLTTWTPATVTGRLWLYSLSRRADYTAGLDRIERMDAADPGGGPHSLAYTVLDPATQEPLQVHHTAAQLDALLDIGQSLIEAAWSTWHLRRGAIMAAQTVEVIKAVTWEATA